eukprot:TRINITY_DN35716_c0_g1_i1.p1 TRINITY_DN35716_c0_g1~~TRINITY_DN35716_c0_g1_i1.p1  ORF type:complete len:437 (+),score=47.56 TRINITY_DN35716_c0_g1_i1:119-1429(+)
MKRVLVTVDVANKRARVAEAPLAGGADEPDTELNINVHVDPQFFCGGNGSLPRVNINFLPQNPREQEGDPAGAEAAAVPRSPPGLDVPSRSTAIELLRTRLEGLREAGIGGWASDPPRYSLLPFPPRSDRSAAASSGRPGRWYDLPPCRPVMAWERLESPPRSIAGSSFVPPARYEDDFLDDITEPATPAFASSGIPRTPPWMWRVPRTPPSAYGIGMARTLPPGDCSSSRALRAFEAAVALRGEEYLPPSGIRTPIGRIVRTPPAAHGIPIPRTPPAAHGRYPLGGVCMSQLTGDGFVSPVGAGDGLVTPVGAGDGVVTPIGAGGGLLTPRSPFLGGVRTPDPWPASGLPAPGTPGRDVYPPPGRQVEIADAAAAQAQQGSRHRSHFMIDIPDSPGEASLVNTTPSSRLPSISPDRHGWIDRPRTPERVTIPDTP